MNQLIYSDTEVRMTPKVEAFRVPSPGLPMSEALCRAFDMPADEVTVDFERLLARLD